MPRRGKIGNRRHRADIKQHNGKKDDHGHGAPSYTTPGDWDTVHAAWPCEILTTSGGESLRGKQVAAQTTHVFFGEYHGASSTTADMELEVDGVRYAVVWAGDWEGDRREMRVETRRET